MQLADAIAANRTLQQLDLGRAELWDDAASAAAVMRALTGHPSLQVLELVGNDDLPDPGAAGAALGALVAADTGALVKLDVRYTDLGDAGMRPLLDALALNTHLRELDCSNTGMSEAFARHVFLPAVRANTSLRTLTASEPWEIMGDETPPAVLEAEALVAARRNGTS